MRRGIGLVQCNGSRYEAAEYRAWQHDDDEVHERDCDVDSIILFILGCLKGAVGR